MALVFGEKNMTDTQNIKFITMGELLLRLSPPNYEKIRTTDEFKVTYGGAEANVEIGRAHV